MTTSRAIEGFFNFEGWHRFGAYCSPTVLAWSALNAAHGEKYDERFHRMWRYYLNIFAGSFCAAHPSLTDRAVAERVPGGYQPVR